MRKLIIAGVVLVVIGTAIGLLVPAIHEVRMAGKKPATASGLKFIVAFVDNFHGQMRFLPPAIGTARGEYGTVHRHLVPFTESMPEPLADRAVFSWFLSVGDESAPTELVWEERFASTNFPANWLAFHGGPQKDGKTTWEDSFPDGRSNTVLFAMRYRMCNGTPTLWAYDKFDPKAPLIGYYNKDKFQIQPSASECDPKVANSWFPHMGVAMADGSVRWISPDVSARTWALALHPADGEPLGKDWDH